MPKTDKTIAGIPSADYYLIYRLITAGFAHVLKRKNNPSYIPPSKICNISYQQMENIYNSLHKNYPHLFDKTGAIKRKKSNVEEPEKEEKKKKITYEINKVVLNFD